MDGQTTPAKGWRMTQPVRRIAIVVVLLSVGCASTSVQRAKQVSVDVHAVLAAVDDAERTLCNPDPGMTVCHSAVPAWTTEKHQQFSAQLVQALKAGRALNEGVRITPVSPQAKTDLATVSAALEQLTALAADALPANSTVVIALTAAKDGVLRILPLFLE
jgi:hypothetical protein